jgi:outer membrane protein TolC
MKYFIIIILTVVGSSSLYAQETEHFQLSTLSSSQDASTAFGDGRRSVDEEQFNFQLNEVLQEIEQNNPTLKALAGQAQADKLDLRTGIALPDPQVEFARLWGTPATIGNRTDIAVSQSFDIATITGMKLRQAKRRGGLIDLGFTSERTNILLEAKMYLIELAYRNRLAEELNLRFEHALAIAEGYARKLESGGTDRLEYNKVRLNLSAVQGEVAANQVEIGTLLGELQRLNGGVEIKNYELKIKNYPEEDLFVDFEAWYADAEQRAPALQYVRAEVETNRRQLSLAKVEWLPAFSVGYMRERTLGQYYQGVTVGMSIPLWGNANRVKQARAVYTASEARGEDVRAGLYAKLRNLHGRAVGLKATAEEYRSALAEYNGTELLKKALDTGEISLLDYIVELGLYYDAVTRTLDAERDFELAVAELTAMEL